MDNIKTPEELLNFMSSKINYGYLGKNGRVYHYDDPHFDKDWYNEYILETPEELLDNLIGNCWDQVEFEREWFLKNGYEIKTIYEMVNLDYENNYPTHAFLVFKDNDSWYWFENADFNNRGIHKFNTLSELLTYQYNKYLESLKDLDITNDEIDKIIMTEFSTPKKHITANFYINHVMNSKVIEINK